jgi:hypothetical protein
VGAAEYLRQVKLSKGLPSDGKHYESFGIGIKLLRGEDATEPEEAVRHRSVYLEKLVEFDCLYDNEIGHNRIEIGRQVDAVPVKGLVEGNLDRGLSQSRAKVYCDSDGLRMIGNIDVLV